MHNKHAIIFVFLVSLFAVNRLFADMTLVREGVPVASIVIPTIASDMERFAAEELQEYLENISGAKVPIVSEPTEKTEHQIHVGKTVFAQKHIDLSTLPPEGFHIKICGSNLVFTGKDDSGTLFGVYTFLENYLGVRWFWPGNLGEVVPRGKTIGIADIDDRQEPDFILRRMNVSRAGDEHFSKTGRKIGDRELNENELWRLRQKLGGSVDYGGNTHDFGYMVPPAQYGPTHPEYFALVDGKRTWENFDGKHGCQLCTTNPDVIRLCIAYVRKYFDQHPEMAAVSISPNDGGGFCECQNCRALDAVAKTVQVGAEVTEDDSRQRMDEKGKPIITDRIFTFANEVARAVQQSNPSKSVLMLAYAQYVEPPVKVIPEKNIWVQVCLNSDFLGNPGFYAKRMGQFDRWVKMTDNLLIYDYLSWRGAPDLPRNTVPWIEMSIKKYRKAGVQKFFTQSRDNFGAEGLDYYLAAKLLWNANLDASKILDDYCDKCFGPASAPMREWFTLLDQRWQFAVQQLGTDKYAGSVEYTQVMFPLEIRQRIRELFSLAKSKVDGDIQNRIAFFEKEFQYTESTLDFMNTLDDLENAGLIKLNTRFKRIGKIIPADRAGDSSLQTKLLIEKALQAWQKREEIVEQINDEHIIDYWHIDEIMSIRITISIPCRNSKYYCSDTTISPNWHPISFLEDIRRERFD